MSDPTGKGLSPARLLPPPTPHIQFRHQLQVQALICASEQLGIDWRRQRPPPWVLLICQRELRETLTYI